MRLYIVFFFCITFSGNVCAAMDYEAIHEAIRAGNIELAMDKLYRVWNRKDFQQHVHPLINISIQYQQSELAELLITQNQDINWQDGKGSTHLHYAIQYNLRNIALQLARRPDVNIELKNKKGNSPLSLAIQKRNTELAKYLIAKGADINISDENGHTPLHIATLNGNEKLALYLMELGADINRKNVYYETPFIIAVRDSYDNIAQALLRAQNLDTSVQDRLGNSALHYAALNNKLAIIQAIASGDGKNIINLRNDNGRTAIAVATLFGRYQAANRLKQMGAKTNILDNSGRNLLHLSAMSGDRRFIELYNGVDVNHQDESGNSPLQHAAYYQRSRFAIALLDRNPRLEIYNKNGESILHLASRTQNPNLIHALIIRWPNVDVNKKNDKHNTPLHIASKYGRTQVAAALLQHGAQVNALTDQHVTPLHYAALNAYADTATLLMDKGADIHAKTLYGDSILHFAAKNGLSRICRRLLQAKVDGDSRNYGQEYPLYLAIKHGKLDTAQVLFEYGAVIHNSVSERDVQYLQTFASKAAKMRKFALLGNLLPYLGNIDMRDHQGNTLLHYAVLSKNFKMVKTLLKEHADVNIGNNGGNTPLHLALRQSDLTISESLANANGLRQNRQKNTPLHMILEKDLLKHQDWKRYFIAMLKHIDTKQINTVDRNGNTLLHLAVVHRHPDIAQLLLKLGINKDIRNRENNTAFDIARKKRYKKFLALSW